MTKKTDTVVRLLDKIQLPQGVPTTTASGSLLEQGMVLALLQHVPQSRAEGHVDALRKAYEDWNEARVAQAQELAGHLAGRGQKSPDKIVKHVPAAMAVKDYLQEVYQRTHGLDLEFLRQDPGAAAKLVTAMPMLGNYLGSVLLWQAEGEQPVTTALMRVLDRLRLLTRTSSVKKGRVAIEPLVPPDQKIRFSAAFGLVADRWCDARKPICWECPLVDDCPTGRKVLKDWKTQQERLTVQRARDEAKRLAAEKREHARMAREAERERKREEVARQKAERERERQAKRAAGAAKPGAGKGATGKPSAAATSGSKKGSTGKGGGKQAAAKAARAAKSAVKKTGGAKAPARKSAARKTTSRRSALEPKKGAEPKKAAGTKKAATASKKGAAPKKKGARRSTGSKSGGSKRPKTRRR